MYELVINKGFVIDPLNRVGSQLNVGIDNGKIAEVTANSLEGKVEINAEGMVVSPGFIDIHMHEDPYRSGEKAFDFSISDAMLRMGVTTVVGGNCGIGCAIPVRYLNEADRLGYPVNIGLLVPHESIRMAVGGFGKYEAADPARFNEMGDFLRSQLEGGCLGLSFGIEYNPGIRDDEVLSLMRIAAECSKITAVHQRSDGINAVSSVAELIGYASATGAALQISHLSSMCSFGPMEEVLSMIDSCRMKGLDVGFDGYPYYAFSTHLGSAAFDDGFLGKYSEGEILYTRLQVASGDMEGTMLNKESFDRLRRQSPDTLIVAHLLREQEVDRCITHPSGIVVSDGLYSGKQGHPRGSGTFPRLIREYVMNKKLLTLNGAIEKITSLPAARLGLKRKGTLSVGADADITIFDPVSIKDEATYQEPMKSPSGIEYVIVNGQIALKNGEIINSGLGKAVRA